MTIRTPKLRAFWIEVIDEIQVALNAYDLCLMRIMCKLRVHRLRLTKRGK